MGLACQPRIAIAPPCLGYGMPPIEMAGIWTESPSFALCNRSFRCLKAAESTLLRLLATQVTKREESTKTMARKQFA
jgi:hypothetical protein